MNVTGNITASNFYNQAPLTSTPLKSAVYTANASGRSTSNRMAQLTINVPSGPNRKYRLTGKAMAYGDGSTYLLARIVKSTGSAYDYQYEYSNHTGRE